MLFYSYNFLDDLLSLPTDLDIDEDVGTTTVCATLSASIAPVQVLLATADNTGRKTNKLCIRKHNKSYILSLQSTVETVK